MNDAPVREAMIDLPAFRSNLVRLAEAAGRPGMIIDLSANAHGHGLLTMARAVVAAGFSTAVVSDDVALRRVESELSGLAATIRDPGVASSSYAGAGIYGVADPSAPAGLDLVPVMRLVAGVVSVKRVAAGQGVSYGMTYRTQRASTLALVPVGYADGIPRCAGPRAGVQLNGTRYRIAGRVAMDQFVIDVGDDPVELGDPVTVFGSGAMGEPTAGDWADWAGTVADDIVTGIGDRVIRSYRDGPA
ncbi:MAG: alanine racemase [Microbacteriaceae bacterium]